MKKILFVLSLVFVLFAPNYVFAQTTNRTTPTTNQTSTGGSNQVQDGLSSISGSFPNTAIDTTNPQDFIKKIIDWALYLAAMIAVIFIIVGGYMYITSAGSDSKANTGLKTARNALIGLAMIVLSYLIVQVVYNFLVGKS